MIRPINRDTETRDIGAEKRESENTMVDELSACRMARCPLSFCVVNRGFEKLFCCEKLKNTFTVVKQAQKCLEHLSHPDMICHSICFCLFDCFILRSCVFVWCSACFLREFEKTTGLLFDKNAGKM